MTPRKRISVSPEATLLQRARQLEESALATIFDTYYQPLYRYLYHHLGHAPTAEDLTAEVFRRFLDAVHKGRGPTENLQAWLYRVAHNLLVDELRRRELREAEPLEENWPSLLMDVSVQAQQAQLQQVIRRALRFLSPKQQAVLVLHYLEDMEYAEIARALQLSEGAVRALQQRGLRALQRYLKRRGVRGLEDLI